MVRISLTLVAGSRAVHSLATALRPLIALAQTERGCIRCHVSSDLTDPGTLHYVEEWESESDLQREIRSPRFPRLIAVMEAADVRPRFDVQVITQSAGLDYIESALRSVRS